MLSTNAQDTPRPAVLSADTTFDHYRIIGRIGSGGMGEVYKAFDTELERHVALKVLRPAGACALVTLNHPAIVTTYEVVTANLHAVERRRGRRRSTRVQ